MGENEWVVRRGESEWKAKNLADLREWIAKGSLVESDYVYHPLFQRWMYAREIEELKATFATRQRTSGASDDDLFHRQERVVPYQKEKSSIWSRPISCTSGCLVLVAIVFLFGILSPSEKNANDASVSEPRSSRPASAPRYRQALGAIYTGVKLYSAPADHAYIAEVLGGNESYVVPETGERIRAVKVRYPDGAEEWKLRSAVVKWYVRSDDPAISAGAWKVYVY